MFGRKDSRPTQAALRWFKERRVPVSFVDLAQRPPAPTELRRFTDRLGATAVVDTQSRAYRDAGLGYLRMDGAELLERLLANPGLLKLPLVRTGGEVSAGVDEAAWKRMLAAEAPSAQ